MRKFIIGCCIVLEIIFLGGCFNTTDSAETSMFQIIESTKGLTYEIVYNQKTKVMYSVSNSGIMTVLLNSDGTPMLYEE